jgi:predicted Na+-dependent transporter
MLLKTVQLIQKNFTYTLVMALGLGLSIPGIFLPFFQTTLIILGVMMFLSSLRLSWKDIAGEFKNSPALFRESIVFMVVVPLVFYYSVLWVYPRYALAVLLIVATPAAVATPALVGLYQGKVEKSILLVFSTTLLCPVTIPGLVYVLKGQSIELDYFGLLISLCIIVLFPLILAQLFKTWLPILTNKIEPYSGGISVICLSLVIVTSFAIQADRIIENIQEAFYTTLLAFVLLSILLIVVDLMNRKFSAEEYTANVLSHTFKNLSLTVSLAANFFGSDELLLCSISMVPWVCLLPVFRYIQNIRTASFGFQRKNKIRKFRLNRATDIHEKIEELEKIRSE